MRKKLIKAIKNQSVTVERINTTEPLQFLNGFLSINPESLNVWNGYGDEISELDAKVDNNNIEINNKTDTIKTDLGDLGDQVATIQGQQNINTNDIGSLKTKDTQQDTKIEQNSTAITKLIQQLQDSNLINYVGEWQAGTYTLGQVVSYDNKLYLCKVESTTAEPTNTTDWDLLSAPEINLDNYVTNDKLKDELDKYTPVDTFDAFEIDASSRISNLETQQVELTKKVDTKQNIIKSTDTLSYQKWDLGDGIAIYKYSNNELVIVYNEKLSFIDKNDKRVTFLENGEIVNYVKKGTEVIIPFMVTNTSIPVNSWNDYKSYIGIVYNKAGEQLDLESSSVVSDNMGGYGGFSRSYVNKQPFYKKIKLG